jgi:hypothetical protein
MIDFGLYGKGALVSGAGDISERAGHCRMCSLKLAEAGAGRPREPSGHMPS